MSIFLKKWIDLREMPDDRKSETSFIRLSDIERVSFIENISDKNFTVLVTARGGKFLYDIVETEQEANDAAKGLIQDIENALK